MFTAHKHKQSDCKGSSIHADRETFTMWCILPNDKTHNYNTHYLCLAMHTANADIGQVSILTLTAG